MSRISAGRPMPLGASITDVGVQFAVFSRHATEVSLLLFSDPEADAPDEEILFDSKDNKTGDIWHIEIEGLQPGQLYMYRIDGPFDPYAGHRFNRNKFLLDPYAKAITGDHEWDLSENLGYDPHSQDKDLSFSEHSGGDHLPKCIVIDEHFDWEGDRPLNYPLRFSVIYETHVRSLTMKADIKHPGTYKGIIEMIPYLKELGVTSLELLPTQEFDELENMFSNPETGEKLEQYWGYSTLSFFAPKGRYSSSGTMGQQVVEFKEMVKALHKEGIEIIMDVVFNHTAEGSEMGPTLSFRGIDNSIYYMLDDNRRYYKNYTGCGNTLNCNHPLVRNFIIDCLHYWVVEMHVDGFRFDLGSILGRDQKGNLLENPPILERIAEDPILRHTKIIAEAWDAAGAYQVGWFPGGRWAEWNDKFRDEVRRFWMGEPGMITAMATRITGSSDLYLRDGRKPFHSINFVTSHDGFTLNDLVSYNSKHNEANGEDNRDGHNHNISFNHGVEGHTTDSEIEDIRVRQIKNFITTLLISLGTPMILGGDEIRRTQQGNNNAYCQNNELSYFDWALLEENKELFNFTRKMLAFRKAHPAFHRPEFYTGEDLSYNAIPDITWFDERGRIQQWKTDENLLSFRIDGSKAEILADADDNDFLILINGTDEDVPFALPHAPESRRWYLQVDTSCHHGDDFREDPSAVSPQKAYMVTAKSMVIMISM